MLYARPTRKIHFFGFVHDYPNHSDCDIASNGNIENWEINLVLLGSQSEKAMATPVLLPGKSHGQRSLGGLQFTGSGRVRHDWANSLSLFTFMHWRRQWQATPVFLPGESQGQRSLVGCRLWGCTE